MVRQSMAIQPLGYSRQGYTLLEVVLATAIAVILLGALYVALEMQTRHAQDGRDKVQEAALARNLLVRMSNDIGQSLGPVPIASSTTSSSSSATGTTGSTAAPATSGTTGTQGATGTDPAATTPSSSTPTTTTPTATTTTTTSSVVFNQGVQGVVLAEGGHRLTIYVSRVPREVTYLPSDRTTVDGQSPVSDLRRITYWIVGADSGTPLGLARQEMPYITADDETSNLPPDIPDEARYVVAEEVKSLEFRYFDGTTWVDSWDGTELGADSKNPKGPPLAIEIVLGILPSGVSYANGGKEALKYFTHVVVLHAANGLPQLPAEESTTPTTGTTASSTAASTTTPP